MSLTTLPIDLIKACVAAHVPCKAGAVKLEKTPAGHFNESFFIQADSRALVLRIAPTPESVFLFYERGMMRQEPGLHALLRAKTGIPVAKVIAFDDTHRVIGRDFLLMERLPGMPMSLAPFFDENMVLEQVGAYLAQAHALHASEYGYLGEHKPLPARSGWLDAFVAMWQALLKDVLATGHYSASEHAMMLRLLDNHLACFDRKTPASLLHMDVWGQNILVDNAGNVSGIIDWDRALWGDPEIEFAVLDYCGISTPAFWDGYGQRRETSPEAHVRNLFYLLYEVQKYIVIYEGRKHDSAAAKKYKQATMRIAAELGEKGLNRTATH
jgi:aminoglycoside phosphotransferase (APT) family kinase protein